MTQSAAAAPQAPHAIGPFVTQFVHVPNVASEQLDILSGG